LGGSKVREWVWGGGVGAFVVVGGGVEGGCCCCGGGGVSKGDPGRNREEHASGNAPASHKKSDAEVRTYSDEVVEPESRQCPLTAFSKTEVGKYMGKKGR